MRKLSAWVFGVCVFGLMTAGVFADLRGMNRIAGTVTDDGGAPMAGVAVKATFETGGVLDATTDDKGAWAVGGMGKGEWSVVFAKPGYSLTKAKVVLPADMSRVPPIKIVLKKE